MAKGESSVILKLPVPWYRFLRRIRDRIRHSVVIIPSGRLNLLGDRDVEWSWVAANMPPGPGRALDFGSGQGFLSLVAVQGGFSVTAVDLQAVAWPFHHPRLHVLKSDLMELSLPKDHFDVIINCS